MILKLIHLLKRKANMKCCTVFNWNGRWNLFLVGFVKDGRLHDPINLPMSFFWYTDQTIKVYGCRTTEPLLFWSFNHIKYKFIKLQESISIFGIAITIELFLKENLDSHGLFCGFFAPSFGVWQKILLFTWLNDKLKHLLLHKDCFLFRPYQFPL